MDARVMLLAPREEDPATLRAYLAVHGIELCVADRMDRSTQVFANADVVLAHVERESPEAFERLRDDVARALGRPLIALVAGAGAVDEELRANVVAAGGLDAVCSPPTSALLALHIRRAAREAEARRHEGTRVVGASFSTLRGSSDALQVLRADLARAARDDRPCIVSGETGCELEEVAAEIHARSARRAGPYIAIRGDHLGPDDWRAEFWGRPTDAHQTKPGLLEGAAGGSLVVAHAERIPDDVLVDLFKVPGSSASAGVASLGRLILCATVGWVGGHSVVPGAVVRVLVPSLRERASDVPVLAAEVLARAAQRHKKPLRGFSPEALDVLCGHSWPGNARELVAVVEHSAAAALGTQVTCVDLPRALR